MRKCLLSSMPVNEHAQCFQLVSEQMERQCGTKVHANPVFRWKYTKEAAAVLSKGASLLDGYVLDTVPRSVFAVSDSIVVTKTGNTNSDDSGALFARAYSARAALWKDRSESMLVFCKIGGKQSDFLQMIKNMVAKFCANGDSSSSRGHLVLLISMNDVTQGKQYVPTEKLNFTREIVALLKLFPQGTVSIIGPSSESNWSSKKGQFTHLAETYFACLLECGHPMYNPEYVYGLCKMNRTFSLVKIDKVQQWEGKEKKNKFYNDFHFSENQENYDLLVRMTIDVVTCTQFLGNLIDVAKMEGADIDTTHFPVYANFGACRADLPVSSGAKANATTPGSSGAQVSASTLLTTVKEEEDTALTILAVLAHDAGLFRPLVRGDTFKTRPNGHGAAGGHFAQMQGIFHG